MNKLDRNQIIACTKNIGLFSEFFEITTLLGCKIKFIPRAWQKQMFGEMQARKLVAVRKGRQIGATMFQKIIALHTALFQRNKRIFHTGSRLHDSHMFIAQVLELYNSLPAFLKDLSPIVNQTKTMIELSNGSVIKSKPYTVDWLHSEAVNLLIIDELAHLRDAAELYKSLIPAISWGGQCLIMSTPSTKKNNIFQQMFESGAFDTFKFDSISGESNINIEAERTTMPKAEFEAELYANFPDEQSDLEILRNLLLTYSTAEPKIYC